VTVVLALLAALLFGAATPAAKVLLAGFSPYQLAGLFYLGATLGAAPALRREARSRLDAANRLRLVGAVAFGGLVGPVLFLGGLRFAGAASVSLLLNFEMAFTAVLGVTFFGEHVGRRGWLGVAGVVVAGAVLAWGSGWPGAVATLLVVAACLCWALDNNLTALIDGISPSGTTFWKGLVAGATNLTLGIWLAPLEASTVHIVGAIVVGALAYGVSIVLYITAAQQAGATRTQGIFAAAPFVGATLSWLLLGEEATTGDLVAVGILLPSIALLVGDRHDHLHAHEPLAHVHGHRHDDGHHLHDHPGHAASERHSHWHQHEAVEHAHPHGSDLHHRHGR